MSEKETLAADEYKTIECDEKNIHRPQIKHFTIDFGKCPVYGQYTQKFPLEKLQNTVNPGNHSNIFFSWNIFLGKYLLRHYARPKR